MSQKTEEITFFAKLFGYFSKKRKLQKGDLGVYKDTLSYNPVYSSTRSLQYDIYIKVRAVEVYDHLVEVEVIDTKMTTSEDLSSLIKIDNIKYLDPKLVKWQLQ